MGLTMERVRGAAWWTAVAGVASWALTRLFGVERGFPAVQLIAFTPYVAAAAVAVGVAALVRRRWAAGAVASLAAIALVAAVLPRAVAGGGAVADGPALRVLSANLLAGSGSERAVVDLVRRYRIDVLAIQEYTASGASGLDAAGVADLLPHRAAYPRPGVVGSALYSRHPLAGAGLRVHASGFTQAYATVAVPGAAPVEVESVHPCAPSVAESVPRWERDLAAQPPADSGGAARILLGDFNATLDHAALRRLLDTGYADAADVVGAGLRATWPYDEKWFIPGVTLDRVLVDRRVGVRRVRAHRIPGSDHKAVYADLVLPPG